MFEWIVKIFFGIIILFVVGLIVMLFVALGTDFYKTMRYGIGTVSQDRKTEFVKEFGKEEGGCIYYTDVWDNAAKTCGAYAVERYNP